MSRKVLYVLAISAFMCILGLWSKAQSTTGMVLSGTGFRYIGITPAPASINTGSQIGFYYDSALLKGRLRNADGSWTELTPGLSQGLPGNSSIPTGSWRWQSPASGDFFRFNVDDGNSNAPWSMGVAGSTNITTARNDDVMTQGWNCGAQGPIDATQAKSCMTSEQYYVPAGPAPAQTEYYFNFYQGPSHPVETRWLAMYGQVVSPWNILVQINASQLQIAAGTTVTGQMVQTGGTWSMFSSSAGNLDATTLDVGDNEATTIALGNQNFTNAVNVNASLHQTHGTVVLQPTGGASQFVVPTGSGNSLTITAGDASTWSSSRGDLNLDAASDLNLGQITAAHVNIGAPGGTPIALHGHFSQNDGAFSFSANAASSINVSSGGLSMLTTGNSNWNTTGYEFLEATSGIEIGTQSTTSIEIGQIGVGNTSILNQLSAKQFALFTGSVTSGPCFLIAPGAGSSGTKNMFEIRASNDTGQTAGTEVFGANFNYGSGSRTWAAGNITTERETRFGIPTYTISGGASTITNAATVAIEGAPASGGGTTITNPFALWVQAGATRLDGNIGFFSTTPAAQQASGANLTNNVTSGGTDNTIADFSSLTVYATDAATIRNDIYQLSRKLKQVNDALRLYGLLN